MSDGLGTQAGMNLAATALADPLAGVPGIVGWWEHDKNVMAVGGGLAGEGVAVGSWGDRRGTGQTLATATVPWSRPIQRISDGWVEMLYDSMEFSHTQIAAGVPIRTFIAMRIGYNGVAGIAFWSNGATYMMTILNPGSNQSGNFMNDSVNGATAITVPDGGVFGGDVILEAHNLQDTGATGAGFVNLKTLTTATINGRIVEPNKFTLNTGYGGPNQKIRAVLIVAATLTAPQLAQVRDYLTGKYP